MNKRLEELRAMQARIQCDLDEADGVGSSVGAKQAAAQRPADDEVVFIDGVGAECAAAIADLAVRWNVPFERT